MSDTFYRHYTGGVTAMSLRFYCILLDISNREGKNLQNDTFEI